ncbi:hypothetical protein N1851_018714 [Merluccius polli]|uniref:Reverse transcriptase domain-containing protein n=1 Tax=Merluccius polli TaxID=89951 RepID=A0AA47P062_MERPO|nr:hypothetical protein N1851_018714 [Merluccius polli]
MPLRGKVTIPSKLSGFHSSTTCGGSTTGRATWPTGDGGGGGRRGLSVQVISGAAGGDGGRWALGVWAGGGVTGGVARLGGDDGAGGRLGLRGWTSGEAASGVDPGGGGSPRSGIGVGGGPDLGGRIPGGGPDLSGRTSGGGTDLSGWTPCGGLDRGGRTSGNRSGVGSPSLSATADSRASASSMAASAIRGKFLRAQRSATSRLPSMRESKAVNQISRLRNRQSQESPPCLGSLPQSAKTIPFERAERELREAVRCESNEEMLSSPRFTRSLSISSLGEKRSECARARRENLRARSSWRAGRTLAAFSRYGQYLQATSMAKNCALAEGQRGPKQAHPGSTAEGKHRKRCDRTRKRGKRGGARARLAANPHKPAIPRLLLSNVRSLDNKMDFIRLWRASQRDVRTVNCCATVFTETWLNQNITDAAAQLEGLMLHRADRSAALTGKRRGGGLAVYINRLWCQDSVTVTPRCSQHRELLTVRCRPFYLPRELSAVFITAVYVPPSANVEEAMSELYNNISEKQQEHPDAFNQASLTSVLPKFYQHVNVATRGNNTLDLVYTNIKNSYKAEPLPHIGNSDHITVRLTPAYRPRVKRDRPVVNKVRMWPQEATEALQDCFDTTHWDIFREAATQDGKTDLQEYTDSVISYINKCIEDVAEVRTIKRRANQKPWLTGEICHSDPLFPGKLNTFYARFEAKNTTQAQTLLPALNDWTLQLTTAGVRKALASINPRKAAGPDNIPGCVLKNCAEQLKDVFTDIFNMSLRQTVVPTCLKMHFNTIIQQQLVEKLQLLKVDNSICNWVHNFLTQREQTVRVGSRTSRTITVSTGSPQGCVLSPLLFSLLTHDCTARFCSNYILKFADDTTVVGLIKNNMPS